MSVMSDARKHAAPVRRYLEALDDHKPKRGRRRTPDSIARRLKTLKTKIAEAPAMQRLALIQERIDLESELAALDASADLSKFEEGFIASAKAYGEAKGITYTAWRELGVSPEVLKKAGIARTRRRSS